MWIWCSNCGWHRDVPSLDVKKILRDRKFVCSSCETIHTLLEKENLCLTLNPFIFNEEEMRCVILNTLLRLKARVWDCRPESGMCPDPIWIPKIPLRPKFGDGVLNWKDRFWMLEFKFEKMRCQFDEDLQNWQSKRDNPVIEEGQNDVLLNEAGILVIMAESPPSQFNISIGGVATKKECLGNVNSIYRKHITENKIPYEVYVLNPKSYKKLWTEFLEDKDWEEVERRDKIRRRKGIGWKELEGAVKDKRYFITLQDFMNGAVADLILQSL